MDNQRDDDDERDNQIQLPNQHVLSGKEHLLDTHKGHLQAYAEILAEANPDETHGVMLIKYSQTGADTLPSISEGIDPRWASLWMLGAHIHHLASSAQQSGGHATMEDVAKDAIEYVRDHGIGAENDGKWGNPEHRL